MAGRPLEVAELVVAVDGADRVVDEVHQVLEAAGVVEGARAGAARSLAVGPDLCGQVAGLDDDRVGGDQLRAGGLGGRAEGGQGGDAGAEEGGRGSGSPC